MEKREITLRMEDTVNTAFKKNYLIFKEPRVSVDPDMTPYVRWKKWFSPDFILLGNHGDTIMLELKSSCDDLLNAYAGINTYGNQNYFVIPAGGCINTVIQYIKNYFNGVGLLVFDGKKLNVVMRSKTQKSHLHYSSLDGWFLKFKYSKQTLTNFMVNIDTLNKWGDYAEFYWKPVLSIIESAMEKYIKDDVYYADYINCHNFFKE